MHISEKISNKKPLERIQRTHGAKWQEEQLQNLLGTIHWLEKLATVNNRLIQVGSFAVLGDDVGLMRLVTWPKYPLTHIIVTLIGVFIDLLCDVDQRR